MKIEYTRAARKSLHALPERRRGQIATAIARLADPAARADTKPLAGSDLSRLRVGAYRVLYSIDTEAETIRIELIRTRGDVYKR